MDAPESAGKTILINLVLAKIRVTKQIALTTPQPPTLKSRTEFDMATLLVDRFLSKCSSFAYCTFTQSAV